MRSRRALPLSAFPFALALVAACAATPTSTIDVVTGEEADALTRAPAPTVLVVESVDATGKAKELSRASLPSGGDLSLGDVGTSDVGSLRVTARGAAGEPLVRGETLLFQFGALQDASLSVFVQRTGELARVPASPTASLDAPRLDTVLGRFLVGASGTTTVLYDLLLLHALTAPTLPRAATAMASYGSVLLLVDQQGATSFDLSNGSATVLATPSGGSFAEIAGGATVNAPDGSTYIVGGTRTTGDPTARVLRLSGGVVTFASLATPRAGACATWVEGRGLVVIGGSDGGAGAEVLAPSATQGAPLPFPADATKGCGAATLDASHVVIVGGGGDGARTLDLACGSACQPSPWQGSAPLARAEVVTLAADAALAVGDDATGATRAFRVSASGAREVPLRVPRRGARLVPLPNGAAAIVGGAAAIETYRD